MPRLTKIYTRTGDDGTTALGGGERVSKTSPRIKAYGTVDELNAHIGSALASGVAAELVPHLKRIQNELFHLGSDLCVLEADKAAMPVPGVEARHVASLEKLMDEITERVPPLTNFVMPGGSAAAAQLHVARTVCRRAERAVVALAKREKTGAHVVTYLNRLSDALFLMSRLDNHLAGIPEPTWESRA